MNIEEIDFVVNPAECVLLAFEAEPHDCVAESLMFFKLRTTPLLEKDVIYLEDGSCFQNEDGYHAGYAIVQRL